MHNTQDYKEQRNLNFTPEENSCAGYPNIFFPNKNCVNISIETKHTKTKLILNKIFKFTSL